MLWGVVGHQGLQGFKALGMGGDVVSVRPAFLQHHLQQAVAQQHVGAGLNLQMQIGHLGGVGATRVNHDHFHVGVGAACVFDAPEQNGMRPSRVAARYEQALRQRQVFVARGWGVGPQGHFVARHGAAHAQA